ncbi:Protein of unknown function [Bacillus cereus]|uniref:Uncharacterized protein n=1 Tax=Bacillus wiedmannii TaxID=1890302 RepID=A0A1C4CNE5_9BACI|nr:Protein of unknown function [Bacillus cereus]SCC20616.1 Protein of unknown function [Bacillus wiedmannii]SCL92713.1 Protein of unknown function [Bacillus wiedmannii]SCN03241.1 Protein of unknown function [Bacillus wiedmannii]SCN31846.1 Protein of unknown function [Bacillus cereus]
MHLLMFDMIGKR